MTKLSKGIVRRRKLIVLIGFLLLIPSFFGIVGTRTNYDIQSYLPGNLETVKGQDILMEDFGMGAFSMVVVENMDMKDVAALEKKLEGVEHVKDVLWYGDLFDISVPVDMLPKDIKAALKSGDATMLIALFDDTTSSDVTMEAITKIREITGKQCFVSGMSGLVTDIKNLFLQEMPIYVAVAALLCLLVLCLAMESFAVPFIFLLSIGMAIVYNLGSNIFLGEISYITKALTAVLQLGVTTDYSIFLLNSYEDDKERFGGDKERAMAHAISNTFKSVAGSSVTTIAGFAALCGMSFTLGMDIGIVMMKGVALGVICCITFLPAMILLLDGLIEKTRHKSFVPDLSKLSHGITKHYKIILVIFLLLLAPALYGNSHTKVYYNLDKSLPKTLPSSMANRKLEEDFKMNSTYMLLLKNGMSAKERGELLDKVSKVDGVKWTLGLDSVIGPGVPEEMLPADVVSMLRSDNYEVAFVCSNYSVATDEVNAQIGKVNDIVKEYSKDSMVIGEAPLTKDLVDVTDVDFRNVNILSILAIFIIILIVFKSISLPVILVAVIEFAICVNMAVPCFTGEELPFVASIVIGTIQLGATVDYAILMTNRYQKERGLGKGKQEAIRIAHETSMKSIIISGLSFFAATFGVGLISKIDMIGSICKLLSRGAIISTIVVLCVLPALFTIFDPLIVRTSKGFREKKSKAVTK